MPDRSFFSAIGMRIVGHKLRALPDFPPLVRSLLEHMILSHHGQTTPPTKDRQIDTVLL